MDPLELDGTAVPGANESINVETSVIFNLPNITHFDIDDNLAVRDWLLTRYRQHVNR